MCTLTFISILHFKTTYAIKYRFPYRNFDQLSNDGEEGNMARTAREVALKLRY